MTELHSETIDENLARGEDGRTRCTFNIDNPVFRAYHDEEFGRPTADDRRIFEKISLEGFASGLSLLTVLTSRDAYRAAFDDFDVDTVAGYDGNHMRSLMANDAIVQNRAKIESVVNNAKRAREMRDEYGSLAAFVWGFEPDPSERPDRIDMDHLKKNASSAQSERMAKVMKDRGWTFVGPTTLYALMQSIGVVNDHFDGCDFRRPCLDARAAFDPPQRR